MNDFEKDYIKFIGQHLCGMKQHPIPQECCKCATCEDIKSLINKHYIEKKEVEKMIETHKKYIKLLEKECERVSVFLFTHGMSADQKNIDKAETLREEIKTLSLLQHNKP